MRLEKFPIRTVFIKKLLALIPLVDDRYWLTERQKIPNNAQYCILCKICILPTKSKTKFLGILYDLWKDGGMDKRSREGWGTGRNEVLKLNRYIVAGLF